jgi:AcrR family transcriptional regulator
MNIEKSQEAMEQQNLPKRKYNSARRKAQASETRLNIAEAARKLFFERGYAGATIDAIAQEAGVATETIYAIFGSKSAILAFLLDISIGGDDQPIRVIDRSEPQEVLRDTDQARQLAGFAQGIAQIMHRAAPVFEMMRTAAKTEPEIEQRLERLLQERLENLTGFVRHLSSNGPLRPGLDVPTAGEIVWTQTSPEVFVLLTRDRGLSTEKYAAWLEETLKRLLLP